MYISSYRRRENFVSARFESNLFVPNMTQLIFIYNRDKERKREREIWHIIGIHERNKFSRITLLPDINIVYAQYLLKVRYFTNSLCLVARYKTIVFG